MKYLSTKFEKKENAKKGFTLMEMLIVVAIIAILVAVSIPVFTSQLEKAKKATDLANQRAAKAVAAATFLTEELTADTTYSYDAANGKLVENTEKFTYGKCTSHKGGYLTVKISKDTGAIEIKWADIPSGGSAETDANITTD